MLSSSSSLAAADNKRRRRRRRRHRVREGRTTRAGEQKRVDVDAIFFLSNTSREKEKVELTETKKRDKNIFSEDKKLQFELENCIHNNKHTHTHTHNNNKKMDNLMKNIALFSSAFIIIPAGRDVISPLTPLPGMDDGKMLQLMNPSGKGNYTKKIANCLPIIQF